MGGLAITTTFTPPPQCTQSGHATILNAQAFDVWYNEPRPVPGVTITSCYPPEFGSSFLAGGNLPAFSTLVCPDAWNTATQSVVNGGSSTYIACCPDDFQLHILSPTSEGRPAFGGTCYSNIAAGGVTVTAYDDSQVVATSLLPSTTWNQQIYAHPMDGYALQQAVAAQSVVGPVTAPAQILPAASAKPSSSPPKISATIPSSTLPETSHLSLVALGSGSPTKPADTSLLQVEASVDASADASAKASAAVISNAVFGTVLPSSSGESPGSQSSNIIQPASTSSQSNFSTAAIVAVVLGVLLFLLVFAAALFFLQRQRRQRQTNAILHAPAPIKMPLLLELNARPPKDSGGFANEKERSMHYAGLSYDLSNSKEHLRSPPRAYHELAAPDQWPELPGR